MSFLLGHGHRCVQPQCPVRGAQCDRVHRPVSAGLHASCGRHPALLDQYCCKITPGKQQLFYEAGPAPTTPLQAGAASIRMRDQVPRQLHRDCYCVCLNVEYSIDCGSPVSVSVVDSVLASCWAMRRWPRLQVLPGGRPVGGCCKFAVERRGSRAVCVQWAHMYCAPHNC